MTCKNYLKGLFCAVICLTINAYAHGQDIPKDLYIASTIPDSLKEDANSVVRYDSDIYEVKGPGRAVKKFHTIVTILNEKANDEAEVRLPYNKKFSTVGSFEMKIYDATGKVIKKYHKSDMYDGLDSDNETLVTDDRFLAVRHVISSYPVTIEMEFEVSDNSLINIGSWHFLEPEQSIQNSSCQVLINGNAGFRYLNKNTSIKPKIEVLQSVVSYTWQVSNIKASKPEEGSKQWRVLPSIEFCQDKFEFFGMPGDISSWQNYGKWQQALNADVCTLSPERAAEIKKMTDTIKTDKGKAKFLYNYMQQSMRYVNIVLGIGGLKPLPATFVDQKKYGDCKALSNYMYALLKAVGIPSYFAEINAGANGEPADFNFPRDPFNHIILCVPFKNDTTWLECTSSTQPFGKLGSFTENRMALLVTEDGGKLVNTPKSTAEDNQFNSEIHIKLETDGSAKAQVKILSTGELRDLFVDALPQLKADRQKEVLLRELNIKQPSAFDFQSGKDVNGIKEVDLDIDYDKFCDVMTGDKQFYRPVVLKYWDVTVPVLEKRKTDYYFRSPMEESNLTTIDLPAGYEIEAMPSNVSLKFSYGHYEINYAYDAAKNQVVSKAKFILNNQVIPAAKYTEMQQYMDGIAKAQNKKLVIRKKA